MSISDLVYAARESAAGLRTDTCVVRRKSGSTFDESTGTYVDAYVEVWSGACRVKPRNLATREVEAGERLVSLHTYVVSLTIDVATVRVGDVLEVLTSETDPALPGTVMRVQDVTKGSQISARRLVCEEVIA